MVVNDRGKRGTPKKPDISGREVHVVSERESGRVLGVFSDIGKAIEKVCKPNVTLDVIFSSHKVDEDVTAEEYNALLHDRLDLPEWKGVGDE